MKKIKITRQDYEAIERAYNWQIESYRNEPEMIKEIERQKKATLEQLEPHDFIKMAKGIPL